MNPDILAIAQTKWPTVTHKTQVVEASPNVHAVEFPILDDPIDILRPPEPVRWERLPGIKALFWRVVGRITNRLILEQRGLKPIFPMPTFRSCVVELHRLAGMPGIRAMGYREEIDTLVIQRDPDVPIFRTASEFDQWRFQREGAT